MACGEATQRWEQPSCPRAIPWPSRALGARPSTSVAICGTISCQARAQSILSAHPVTTTTHRRPHAANACPLGGSAMDLIWEELAGGIPDPRHLVRLTMRLVVAMLVGAVVGLQRQSAGQSAGLRTH